MKPGIRSGLIGYRTRTDLRERAPKKRRNWFHRILLKWAGRIVRNARGSF